MKQLKPILSAILFSALTAVTANAEEIALTGDNTSIKFTGTKPEGSHSGSFAKVEGKLNKEDDVTKSKLSLTIKIDSLTSDADKLTAHLKSPDFFDAKKHPEAKFVSKSFAAGTEKDSYTVEGELTMLGKTKSVTIPAKATTKDDKTTFASTFKIKRSDWGMTYGSDKVNDEVELALEVKIPAKK